MDNFEGLAIVALPNFNVRVYLMSDDNFDAKTQVIIISYHIILYDIILD